MTLVQEAAKIIESMPRKNQQIVLELLRMMGNRATTGGAEKEKTSESMKTAALGLAGLWSSHENELPVEEAVRNLRKGRSFDY